MAAADPTTGGQAERAKSAAGGKRSASRSRQDPALKRVFAITALFADFLLSSKPKHARLMDMATLEPRPTEHVGPTLDYRLSDIVWCGIAGGLLVFVIVEFQKTVDPKMPYRMTYYRRGVRSTALAQSPDANLGGTLPLVLYTGERPWTAPLHRKGEGAGEFAEEHHPPPRYALVDLARSEFDDLDGESVFAVVQRIHRAESMDEVEALWPELVRRSLARGGTEAYVAIAAFVLELLKPLGGTEELRAKLEAAADAEKGDGAVAQEAMSMLEARAVQWTREWTEQGRAKGVKEGRAKGVEEGRAEGERRARADQAAMLLRQAERKFGPEAAERLAGAATPSASSEGLARLGEWIIDCDTPEELLAQVENGVDEDQP